MENRSLRKSLLQTEESNKESATAACKVSTIHLTKYKRKLRKQNIKFIEHTDDQPTIFRYRQCPGRREGVGGGGGGGTPMWTMRGKLVEIF